MQIMEIAIIQMEITLTIMLMALIMEEVLIILDRSHWLLVKVGMELIIIIILQFLWMT